MNSSLAFFLRISWQRVQKERSYYWACLVSVSISTLFLGVSIAWHFGIVQRDLPWPAVEKLHILQIHTGRDDTLSHPDFQQSYRLLFELMSGLDTTTTWLAYHTEVSDISDKRSLQTLEVSPGTPQRLGWTLEAGRWPYPDADKSEVVISKSFALYKFGSIHQALQQSLQLGDNIASQVVGVVSEGQILPAPVTALGYEPFSLIYLSRFVDLQQQVQQRDMQGILKVILQTDDRQGLENQLRKLLAVSAFRLYRTETLQIKLQGVEDYVRSTATTWSIRLLGFSFFLFSVVMISCLLLQYSRYQVKQGEMWVRRALGADLRIIMVPELLELLIFAMFILVLSIILLFPVAWVFSLYSAESYHRLVLFSPPIILLLIVAVTFLQGCLLLVSLRPTNAQAANIRGTTGHTVLFACRLMLVGQLLFALAISAYTFRSLDQSLSTLKHHQKATFQDLYWLRIDLDSQLDFAAYQPQLHDLKQQLLEMEVTDAAFSSVGHPLRLISLYSGQYQGGEPDRNAIVQYLPNGKVRMESQLDQTDTNYQYQVNVVFAEVDFIRLLGMQVATGRLYEDNEQNVVMLSEAAKQAIWRGQAPAGSEWPLPASYPPQDQGLFHWNWTLRSVGVVNSMRVQDNTVEDLIAERFPLVFMPWGTSRAAPATTLAEQSVGLLFRRSKGEFTAEQLQHLLGASDLKFHRYVQLSVADEISKSATQQYLTLIAMFFIALVMLSSVICSSAGAMAFLTQQKRTDMGIRKALGANNFSIFLLFIRKEMVLPILILTASCIPLLWFFNALLVALAFFVVMLALAGGAGWVLLQGVHRTDVTKLLRD